MALDRLKQEQVTLGVLRLHPGSDPLVRQKLRKAKCSACGHTEADLAMTDWPPAPVMGRKSDPISVERGAFAFPTALQLLNLLLFLLGGLSPTTDFDNSFRTQALRFALPSRLSELL